MITPEIASLKVAFKFLVKSEQRRQHRHEFHVRAEVGSNVTIAIPKGRLPGRSLSPLDSPSPRHALPPARRRPRPDEPVKVRVVTWATRPSRFDDIAVCKSPWLFLRRWGRISVKLETPEFHKGNGAEKTTILKVPREVWDALEGRKKAVRVRTRGHTYYALVNERG